MLILSIRTDKPEAEIGLFSDHKKFAYHKWLADRHLSETIHKEIDKLLKGQDKKLSDLSGIVCFSGPGSFTGLRIGISVGNALSYGLEIPIVGSGGEHWTKDGLSKLIAGEHAVQVTPNYGAEPHITTPKN